MRMPCMWMALCADGLACRWPCVQMVLCADGLACRWPCVQMVLQCGWSCVVTHWTGSAQWTWIKTAEEHYDTIVKNEYRMIHAHSAHLDLLKTKKSCANAKNEHGKFMTVQRTRTTALKDSADKNNLVREMIAKCSQVIHRTRTICCALQLWRKNQVMKMNQKKK